MIKRYQRIAHLSIEEQEMLSDLVEQTPGMTLYGHRARTAVMLPLPLAQEVARLAEARSISIGQAIVDLLSDHVPRGGELKK